ncbi:guanosine polyphosphate pyrophosphohydrolase [Bordetella hinzii]|uniref:guanosine polyphosphate pyrophosphohydrolase n=1 Tax=Bordetella hinzii TaxID=103855 RepID=UPI0039FBE16C
MEATVSLAFDAMEFARVVHKDQRRKYTNNPYTDHLAEVAGIVATVVEWQLIHPQVMIATAWLHDCMEDHGITSAGLWGHLGINSDYSMAEVEAVVRGVWFLSDLEKGNRAERKRLSRERLAGSPGWVQTIKVADLISNTSSIVQHDPKFAVTYLEEKRLLLDALTKADPRLLQIARNQIQQPA